MAKTGLSLISPAEFAKENNAAGEQVTIAHHGVPKNRAGLTQVKLDLTPAA